VAYVYTKANRIARQEVVLFVRKLVSELRLD
jgi:hypothetical protein